jgi:molecular chaperone HscC
MISRAERMYEEFINARPVLQQWILKFKETLESQDHHLIRDNRTKFGEVLDELENQL